MCAWGNFDHLSVALLDHKTLVPVFGADAESTVNKRGSGRAKEMTGSKNQRLLLLYGWPAT